MWVIKFAEPGCADVDHVDRTTLKSFYFLAFWLIRLYVSTNTWSINIIEGTQKLEIEPVRGRELNYLNLNQFQLCFYLKVFIWYIYTYNWIWMILLWFLYYSVMRGYYGLFKDYWLIILCRFVFGRNLNIAVMQSDFW